jgi:hypothetical protein
MAMTINRENRVAEMQRAGYPRAPDPGAMRDRAGASDFGYML